MAALSFAQNVECPLVAEAEPVYPSVIDTSSRSAGVIEFLVQEPDASSLAEVIGHHGLFALDDQEFWGTLQMLEPCQISAPKGLNHPSLSWLRGVISLWRERQLLQ